MDKELLKYYVYILVDPRDASVFYVGKGHYDRLFRHEKEALAGKDHVNEKKNTIIRDINAAGLKVKPMIVRWGLSESEALTVEAALIDLLTAGFKLDSSKMTMQVKGHHSAVFGLQAPEELSRKHSRGELTEEDIRHNLIAITLNGQIDLNDLYERVRGNWNMNLSRAKKADYVLAVIDGIVVGIFRPDSWQEVPPDKDKESLGRNWIRFTGEEVTDKAIQDLYLYKSITRKKGSSNPVNYLY